MTVSFAYPFVAVLGQDLVKRALILNIIDPGIGGVLISGQRGTAKSTLARGLAELRGVRMVDVPLNVTEDRLVGGIDIRRAIHEGAITPEAGLLSEADDGIVYIDEVNLLPEHIADILLEVATTGLNRVEREGLSAVCQARFCLVGSMNPEEGRLRGALLDSFGLYVETSGEADPALRREIVRRRLEYESGPQAFCDKWRAGGQALAEAIAQARARLLDVAVGAQQLELAARLASEGCCQGHRAELATIRAARALAALEGAPAVTSEHVVAAARLALPHRLREALTLESQSPEPPESLEPPEPQPEAEALPESPDALVEPPETDLLEPPEPPAAEPDDPSAAGQLDDIAPGWQVPLSIKFADTTAQGFGKRSKPRSGTRRGRYVKSREPKGKVADLAIDATIRSAALRGRPTGGGLAIEVRSGDIREKVREHRSGATILFVVDASGSMGASRRMSAVKGAIVSLLGDAYEKRDTVGLVAFRGDRAEVLLDITRSAELAHRRLQELRTGGRTPLALGLNQALSLLMAERIKKPEALQCVLLVSDGRANVTLAGSDAVADACLAAARLRAFGAHSMVLDTELGVFQYGFAKTLAEAMGAQYVKLGSVSASQVELEARGFLGLVAGT